MNQASETQEKGLYFRYWPVAKKAKAVVMLVHGLGEHCQRYNHLAEHLAQFNIALSSMDLPCHGKSEGTRGHIDSFDVYENAVLELYERTKQQHPDEPIFLLGHSMGGLIAAKFLLAHQDKFAGALLSGPAIKSPQEPPAWQVAIIKGIAKLFPKTPILALESSAVSRDPAEVEKYMNDPLIHHAKLTAKFLLNMTNTMEHCKDNAKFINLPIKIMHGSADVMTSPEGSQTFYDSLGSKDKTINFYEGLYHEIFNEPEKDQIFAEMTDWLNARI